MNSFNFQVQHSNQSGYGQIYEEPPGEKLVQLRGEKARLMAQLVSLNLRVQNLENEMGVGQMARKIKRLEVQVKGQKEEIREKDREIKELEKSLESQAQKIQELRADLEEPSRKRPRIE